MVVTHACIDENEILVTDSSTAIAIDQDFVLFTSDKIEASLPQTIDRTSRNFGVSPRWCGSISTNVAVLKDDVPVATPGWLTMDTDSVDFYTQEAEDAGIWTVQLEYVLSDYADYLESHFHTLMEVHVIHPCVADNVLTLVERASQTYNNEFWIGENTEITTTFPVFNDQASINSGIPETCGPIEIVNITTYFNGTAVDIESEESLFKIIDLAEAEDATGDEETILFFNATDATQLGNYYAVITYGLTDYPDLTIT